MQALAKIKYRVILLEHPSTGNLDPKTDPKPLSALADGMTERNIERMRGGAQ